MFFYGNFYIFAQTMQRIYNILTSILGESKQGGYDSSVHQYQFNCPYCADEKGGVDNKYNLEISFAIGKYHCWSCGNAGPISSLILRRGGKSLVNEYFSIINDIKENRFYDLNLFKDNGDIFEERFLKLPKTFKKIDLSTCRDKQLVQYLNKRKIDQKIIDFYHIGVTGWEEEDWGWRNRIIFPSYNLNGDLNYYIGRIYKENDKRTKYKNCTADKNEIVLHEDKIQWDADIYLVEGAIDCIYYPNTISLMGKHLKKNTEIYNKLYERANANIIICLDGDTTENEVKRIYRILDSGRLKNKIKYITLDTENIPYKDFGEIYEAEGKNGIIRAMKTAKQFTEIEMLNDILCY